MTIFPFFLDLNAKATVKHLRKSKDRSFRLSRLYLVNSTFFAYYSPIRSALRVLQIYISSMDYFEMGSRVRAQSFHRLLLYALSNEEGQP